LTIRRRGAQLIGALSLDIWSGGDGDRARPATPRGDGWGYTNDGAGSGTIDGDRVRFGFATDCGGRRELTGPGGVWPGFRQADSWRCCTDRFSGTLIAEEETYYSVWNNGCRITNEHVRLHRRRCETDPP
jgi:hypothetical protein